ncbi:MAG TPA: VWA domain-containing protein [Blastocatellia bacterium]|nr:VWA domain-containing protein [Blastocatellia bacterium]
MLVVRVKRRIRWMASAGVLLFAGSMVTLSAAGAMPGLQDGQKQDEPIKLKATLVQVPVVATDSGGKRYVADLHKNEFEVFENGVKQEIEVFASTEIPFSVTLVLDSSGSTTDQLNKIKSAALAFIDNLRPADRVMIINFDDSVHVQCEFSSDRDVLKRAVEAVQVGQFTQVYEAVYTAVWERLKHASGRKAAIIFTDGIDTASSEISEDDTLDAIADTEGLLVYPIRYSTRGDVERRLERRPDQHGDKQPAMSPEERKLALDRTYRRADEYLHQMADLSGGIVERADSLGDLEGAFGRIAEELRKQYLLGYYPSEPADGAERKITVRVSRPDVLLRARPAYRAPE